MLKDMCLKDKGERSYPAQTGNDFKGSPKKVYKSKSFNLLWISCRLCRSRAVSDPKRCRNLFRQSNLQLLRSRATVFYLKMILFPIAHVVRAKEAVINNVNEY